MDKPIRILVADEHAIVRAGIRALLEKSPGIKVVAEAEDSREMLHLARMRKPDVVVMDAALPNDNGVCATVRLHRRMQPRIPVILLAMNPDGGEAQRALQASASGYLLMKSKPSELGAAIRQVVHGRTYLDPSFTGRAGVGGVIRCEGRLPTRPVLSRRQRETLRLIAEGRNTKEIAAQLGISLKTVDFHRRQLMDRLKTRTIAGLVRDAIRLGLVKLNLQSRR